MLPDVADKVLPGDCVVLRWIVVDQRCQVGWDIFAGKGYIVAAEAVDLVAVANQLHLDQQYQALAEAAEIQDMDWDQDSGLGADMVIVLSDLSENFF